MLLIYVFGEPVGLILLAAFYLICMPIITCLTTRYLRLYGQGHRDVNEQQGGPSPVIEGNGGTMGRKIVISTVVAFVIAFLLLTPSPDPLSAIVIGCATAFVCVVPLLVLARFPFVKSASPSVHTLVAVLVCILAVLLVACLMFMQRISHLRQKNAEAAGLPQPTVVSATR
jgi:hypothetical protein